MKPNDLLEQFKTPYGVANALGCPVERFYEWRSRGAVPLFRQWQIQLVTKGKLKAVSLKDITTKKETK